MNIDDASASKEEPKNSLETNKQNNDKPKKKSVIVWQCLNPECKTNATKRSLRTANSFATAYYGIENDKRKKRKVLLRISLLYSHCFLFRSAAVVTVRLMSSIRSC